MAGIYTGDLRKELGKELMESIEKVINDNAKKHDKYFILVHSDWDPAQRNVLRTRLVIMLEKPPAMLGTICVYVNNKKGIAKVMYALPQDIPTDHVEMSDQGSEGVFDSAKNNNSPIIY